jgi:hypothetical protein
MKNLNKLLLSLFLTTFSLSAADRLYSFMGIQTGATIPKSDVAPTLGVKYGKQSKHVRTALSYNYGANSNDRYQTLIVQIDTGIFKSKVKDFPFKPYAGASFGLMQHNDKQIGKRDRGYLYGLNTGFAYILNDRIDLDLGYKFMKTAKLDNVDNISDIMLSMHYFY